MKNYRVKVKDAHPGMPFYHVDNSGAYMGGGTYITNIIPTENLPLDTDGPKAGPITICTLDRDVNPGFHYVNEDEYFYPLGEWDNVTIFHRIWWRIRQVIIYFGLN